MDAKEIRKQTYRYFESGYACAEVVSRTILDLFSETPRPEVVRAASGFNGGIGGTQEELCGAFTGGILVLGSLLGRSAPGESLKDLGALSRQFKTAFVKEFGSLSCPHLFKGFIEQNEPFGCVKLTAKATVLVADILREFETVKIAAFDIPQMLPLQKGGCPFAA